MNTKLFRTLYVDDVMTRNAICVTADMSVRELGQVLEANEISGAPVVDGADRLIGVVSKTDLLHCCVEEARGEGAETCWSLSASHRAWDPHEFGVVSDFMSSEPITATIDETIAEVAQRMAEQCVHRVVVVDDETLVIGVLTTMDLIEAMGRSPRPPARCEVSTIGCVAPTPARLAA